MAMLNNNITAAIDFATDATATIGSRNSGGSLFLCSRALASKHNTQKKNSMRLIYLAEFTIEFICIIHFI